MALKARTGLRGGYKMQSIKEMSGSPEDNAPPETLVVRVWKIFNDRN